MNNTKYAHAYINIFSFVFHITPPTPPPIRTHRKRIMDSNIMFAATSVPTTPTSVASSDTLVKKYYRKAAHR